MTLTTITNPHAGRGKDRQAPRVRSALHVGFLSGQPYAPPSRHLLDDVDVIVFGRGDRSVTRDSDSGARRLVVRVPDPVMSRDHGSVMRVDDQWVLADPGSKNGAVVAGRPTRHARIRTGDVFELGHTLFFIEETEHPGDAALDVVLDPAGAPLPELATLVPALARDIANLGRIAPSDVPVTLLGPSGTGKEVFARALHQLSGRRGAFIAVNCGGLTPTLTEAELFGHRKGAFSGATADREGYVRAADGGTLFLDELGDLPLGAQAVLLRTLQEREVVPVGDARAVPVDLRVCAATHRDLPSMIAAGTFREDLHARLLGMTLHLPALRARRADLGLLIGRLLGRLQGGDRARLTPAAAWALFQYEWPLNVRELERTLAAAFTLSAGEPIDLAHLPPAIASARPTPVDDGPPPPEGPDADVDAGDDQKIRSALTAALVQHQGNVSAVAKAMGKGREQIHRWARRFGIDLDSFRR
ncbi:MAG TPA: sigma 54-interacting transcriptional regulator [Kofleriaceae bacterium]|nr:sigma 54-interacting transcriptional regulator [Kofleriaceae bacterium]